MSEDLSSALALRMEFNLATLLESSSYNRTLPDRETHSWTQEYYLSIRCSLGARENWALVKSILKRTKRWSLFLGHFLWK
jgi:hypothetical protein